MSEEEEFLPPCKALSVPDNSGFGFLTLHPTDVARLSAWEAREFATAQQLSNIKG